MKSATTVSNINDPVISSTCSKRKEEKQKRRVAKMDIKEARIKEKIDITEARTKEMIRCVEEGAAPMVSLDSYMELQTLHQGIIGVVRNLTMKLAEAKKDIRKYKTLIKSYDNKQRRPPAIEEENPRDVVEEASYHKKLKAELAEAKTRNTELEDRIQTLGALDVELAEAKTRNSELEDRVQTLGGLDVELAESKTRNTELEDRVQTLEQRLVAKEENTEDEEDIMSDDNDSVEDENDPWIIKFRQLRRYRCLNGNCKVPFKYDKNPQLGRWVDHQKRFYNHVKTGKKGPKNSVKKRPKSLIVSTFIG